MAHVLWSRIAAAVAIEACHRPERTNFERLAANVPANPPTTSTSVVIPQHRPVQIELLGAAEGAVGALTFTLVDGRYSALAGLEVRGVEGTSCSRLRNRFAPLAVFSVLTDLSLAGGEFIRISAEADSLPA